MYLLLFFLFVLQGGGGKACNGQRYDYDYEQRYERAGWYGGGTVFPCAAADPDLTFPFIETFTGGKDFLHHADPCCTPTDEALLTMAEATVAAQVYYDIVWIL